MSFEIGSLRCVKYIEKKPTQYQPNFWGEGWAPTVQHFKKRSKKLNAGGTYRVHCTYITVSCQKRLNKNMAPRTQFQILILV